MLSSFMRKVKGGFLGEGANQLMQGWRSASGGRRHSPPERDRQQPVSTSRSTLNLKTNMSRFHEVGHAVQLLGAEIGAVDQQVALPFVVDPSAPARPETPGQAKPHEEIPQRRGVQDAGVVDRGER